VDREDRDTFGARPLFRRTAVLTTPGRGFCLFMTVSSFSVPSNLGIRSRPSRPADAPAPVVWRPSHPFSRFRAEAKTTVRSRHKPGSEVTGSGQEKGSSRELEANTGPRGRNPMCANTAHGGPRGANVNTTGPRHGWTAARGARLRMRAVRAKRLRGVG